MHFVNLPPFVAITIAETDEEIRLLSNHIVFVRPPAVGTSKRAVEIAAEQWRQLTAISDMKASAPAFRRLHEDLRLSLSALADAVRTIVHNTERPVCKEDVFYLVYPEGLARHAAGIRNLLPVADYSKTVQTELNGVIFRQKKPITYALSVAFESLETEVQLAFFQSTLFEDEDAPVGWRLLRHSPLHPIQRWYVPADQPAIQDGRTLAMAKTEEVEDKAFACLQAEIEATGSTIRDAVHEPNGRQQFPDYRATIDGCSWALEITRPLGEILHGRMVSMGTSRTTADVARAAARSGLSESEISDALQKATNDKSDRKRHLSAEEKYCLLLVDTIGSIDANDTGQWAGCEFDDFDSVVVMWLIPGKPDRVAILKGDMFRNTNAISNTL